MKYVKRTVYGFVDRSLSDDPGVLAVDNDKIVTHRATL